MNLELAIASNLEELAALNDQLERLLAEQGVNAERIAQTRLIVEELACNSIEHGRSAGATLQVRLQVDDDALVLEIDDDGVAFDPRSAPCPDLDAPIEQRPVGGLGLLLVSELADRLDYRRDGLRNVVRVTLLKPFSPVAETLS